MGTRENWAGGLGICGLLLCAGEVTLQLEKTADSQLVFGAAATCIWIVTLWLVMQVAHWMDRNTARKRSAELDRVLRESQAVEARRERQAEERRAAREELDDQARRPTHLDKTPGDN